MKKDKKFTFNKFKDVTFICAVVVFATLYSAYSLVFFATASDGLRKDVVRLHILANSNNKDDQQVKLLVRDRLLKENEILLRQCCSVDDAEEYFNNNKEHLVKVANDVLRENGFYYGAAVSLSKEYYNTRTYGEYTFPAGTYSSLRIVLGEGKGENWWCVMFPPMCVSVAGEIETDEEHLESFSSSGRSVVEEKFRVKFKIIEIYESIRSILR